MVGWCAVFIKQLTSNIHAYENIKFLSFFVFKFRLVVEYHVQTYEVPDDSSCPDHHVKCCKDYIEVAGNCFCMFFNISL